MATILVDTDVYSFITSSNPQRGSLYRPHLEGHTIAVSFVTVGEQYAGILRKIAKGDWNRSSLEKFEARLQLVVVIQYDLEICKVFGEIKATLKNPDGSDRTISSNDLWVAACAKRHSLKLATHNRKHFEGIPGLEIISEAPPIRAKGGRSLPSPP